MKLFKKLASFILAFAMVMAIAMPSVVMAADNYTITITPTTSDHTYEAYQIFEGKLSNDKLSDIKWGNAITEEGQTELKTEYNAQDAADLAEKLSEFAFESEEIKAFAKKASKYLQNPTTAKAGENTAAITVNKAGYYLIKDKDDSLDKKDETYTEFILKVVKDQTVAPKSSKPTSEKKVKDINDSTDTETTEWQDAADWDIGDEVPFKIEGTLPSNYDKYTKYTLKFHDKEEEGLTFIRNSVHVYIDDDEITEGFRVVENPEDKDTFDVVFDDLKNTSAKKNSVIRVEYKSVLNGNANLGKPGNKNTMYMEFSNNPNNEQGGETGKTPKDEVIVFTYKTVINKVDPDRNALKGAEFTLEKKVGDGDHWVEKAVVKNDAGTIFTFTGLDDGVYRLTETKTPEGYNTMNPNPLKFTISATHDVTGDNPQLLTLSGIAETGDVTFVHNLVDGSLTTDIVNKSGSELPSTGGMGTTVLYTAGTLMILAAAAFLVMKKKAESK